MKIFPEICLFVVLISSGVQCFPNISNQSSPSLTGGGVGSKRNAKFFLPIVFILKYEHTCKYEDMDGLCLNSELECLKRDGRVNPGKCSRGLFQGVCCETMPSCTADGGILEIKKNGTKIKVPSPGIPAKACTYRVPKQKGICQLRLDFKDFAMSTSQGGNCRDSKMTIQGDDDLGNFVLCGDLDPGTHMYLNYGMEDAITVSTTFPEMSKSRFEIQISFIECNSLYKAPSGCTQYYTSSVDEVKSFNFPKQQLNNEMYMICVKSAPGKKEIMWETCNSKEKSPQFFISGFVIAQNMLRIRHDSNSASKRINNRNKEFAVASRENRRLSDRRHFDEFDDSEEFERRLLPAVNTAVIGRVAKESENCMGDFISIHGANKGPKFCGQDFPKNVTSRAKPFQLFVHFDEVEPGSEPIEGLDSTPTGECPPGYYPVAGVASSTCAGSQMKIVPDSADSVDIENTGFCLRYTVT